MDKNQVHIFDTTLRDGEQVPGASLNNKQKIIIAKQLEALGVDIIEAGFPISSPSDFKAVEDISKECKNVIVCGLTRAIEKDIDVASEALKKAKHSRIHTGIGASDMHIKYKFKSTKEEILKKAVHAVKYARNKAAEVQFYAEDAGRADVKYLAKLIEAVIKAGAIVVNIPDTTGYNLPNEFGKKIKYLIDNVKNIDKAIISVHCHDDLGLATANTLSGIENGARQAEVTINGTGERAGNTSLEEIVMTLKTRKDIYEYHTKINTKEIYKTSQMVTRLMGMPIQANKAIVGKNAFAHSSGIHQDGILKFRENYEIINPEDVGIDNNSIVLTSRSGRHALKYRLELIGHKLTSKQIDKIYPDFLNLADQKKEVTEDDLLILMGEKIKITKQIYQLDQVEVLSGNKNVPIGFVRLIKNKETFDETAAGTGPVDAIYGAINKIIKHNSILKEFNVLAVTEGIDALAKVNVLIENGSNSYHGFGADNDILVASTKSYLDALNKLLNQKKK